MGSIRSSALGALAVLITGLGLGMGDGHATNAIEASGADTTPPVFTKPPTGAIPLGAVLHDWTCSDPNDEHYVDPVHVYFRAADGESGIDHYEMTDWFSGIWSIGSATRFTTSSATMDSADCFGGGTYSVVIRAVNGAGVSSNWWVWPDDVLEVVPDTPGVRVQYEGSWAVSHCSCWSGGTTHKTRQQGAAVRFQVKAATIGAPLTPTKVSLALVMAKGPDRGVASVFLDGKRLATVDTYSTTRVNRTVVWRKAVSPEAHTLRVVNRASHSHPRIDIDAVLIMLKGSMDAGP